MSPLHRLGSLRTDSTLEAEATGRRHVPWTYPLPAVADTGASGSASRSSVGAIRPRSSPDG
jgi:hypothetical protein